MQLRKRASDAIHELERKEGYSLKAELAGKEKLCILITPDSHNAKEFWTLYQSILRTGMRCHAGVFEEVDGKWIEKEVA